MVSRLPPFARRELEEEDDAAEATEANDGVPARATDVGAPIAEEKADEATEPVRGVGFEVAELTTSVMSAHSLFDSCIAGTTEGLNPACCCSCGCGCC